MKALFCSLLLLCCASCSNYVSTEELNAALKIKLQNQLDESQQLKNYDMQVLDLKLTEMSKDVYAGQSTLSYAGQVYPISMLVLVIDEKDFIVNIPNEDFAFLDEVELEKYRAQLEQEFQTLVGAWDINTLVECNAASEYERQSKRCAEYTQTLTKPSATKQPL